MTDELSLEDLSLAFLCLAEKLNPMKLPPQLQSLPEQEWEYLAFLLYQLEQEKEESVIH